MKSNNKQQIILVFPPAFSVDQPYLATPSLTAYLRMNKIDSVIQLDCNIDAFWYLLQTDNLRRAKSHVQYRLLYLESCISNLSEKGRREYYHLCQAQLESEFALKNIAQAKNYFKRKQPTSMDEYSLHIRTLSKALGLVSAVYYPSSISLHDFNMRFSSQNSKDILAATSSPENPYIDYYRQRVLPRLFESRPSLIGVSLASMSQIIPSFTLAKIARESLPNAKIIFGGQVFNRLVQNIIKIPYLFDFVDYFIIREGETALFELVQHLHGERQIHDVPNLIYFDRARQIAIVNEKSYIEDVEALPPPDFSDLDLSRYLAPAPVLPYQPVRGCYWHRCAFCNHFVVHPPKERAKSPKQVVCELLYLKKRYSTRYFTFVNESIRPPLLRKYAEAITRSKCALQWYAGSRMESTMDPQTLSLLKQSGCKKIYFGLETGSQKILDSMNKGISLRVAESILRNCGKLDIGIHLFLMLGFPTEKQEDIRTSIEVVCDLARLSRPETFTYYISIYQLKPCSSIFNNPAAFDIISIRKGKGTEDLEYLYEFKVADRGGAVNYEAEKAKLESILDNIKGQARYPENVVHFLTMHDMFVTPDHSLSRGSRKCLWSQGANDLKIREGLAFGKIIPYNKQQKIVKTVCLIYDAFADELFIIRDPILWNVAKRLSGVLNKGQLYEEIRTELYKSCGKETNVRRVYGHLLESCIVIPK